MIFKFLFFTLIVRPVVLVIMGLRVRHRERLPLRGPAILVANHNSHLDTMTLMSLMPLSLLAKVRPVAAADYFFESSGLMRWFSETVLGAISLKRKGLRHKTSDGKWDPFFDIRAALAAENIIIYFPEGSRGEPEQMSEFKAGINRIVETLPDVPIYPIFFKGLGRVLPRGEAILVPFFCDVVVGEPVTYAQAREELPQVLENTIRALGEEI